MYSRRLQIYRAFHSYQECITQLDAWASKPHPMKWWHHPTCNINIIIICMQNPGQNYPTKGLYYSMHYSQACSHTIYILPWICLVSAMCCDATITLQKHKELHNNSLPNTCTSLNLTYDSHLHQLDPANCMFLSFSYGWNIHSSYLRQLSQRALWMVCMTLYNIILITLN